MHSTMVGPITNLTTQYILPQFYVVFDDTFTTTTSNNNDIYPAIW